MRPEDALTAGVPLAEIPGYDAELTAIWRRNHGREDLVVIGFKLYAPSMTTGAYYAAATIEPVLDAPMATITADRIAEVIAALTAAGDDWMDAATALPEVRSVAAESPTAYARVTLEGHWAQSVQSGTTPAPAVIYLAPSGWKVTGWSSAGQARVYKSAAPHCGDGD